MKIALDYDRTYNSDKDFWDKFINLSLNLDKEIYLVTARSPEEDALSKEQWSWSPELIPVIYCNGIAKKWFLHHHKNIDIDIWIDDKPDNILSNSTATKEILIEWRQSEEYNK